MEILAGLLILGVICWGGIILLTVLECTVYPVIKLLGFRTEGREWVMGELKVFTVLALVSIVCGLVAQTLQGETVMIISFVSFFMFAGAVVLRALHELDH